jgi:hypothetical protein
MLSGMDQKTVFDYASDLVSDALWLIVLLAPLAIVIALALAMVAAVVFFVLLAYHVLGGFLSDWLLSRWLRRRVEI